MQTSYQILLYLNSNLYSQHPKYSSIQIVSYTHIIQNTPLPKQSVILNIIHNTLVAIQSVILTSSKILEWQNSHLYSYHPKYFSTQILSYTKNYFKYSSGQIVSYTHIIPNTPIPKQSVILPLSLLLLWPNTQLYSHLPKYSSTQIVSYTHIIPNSPQPKFSVILKSLILMWPNNQLYAHHPKYLCCQIVSYTHIIPNTSLPKQSVILQTALEYYVSACFFICRIFSTRVGAM